MIKKLLIGILMLCISFTISLNTNEIKSQAYTLGTNSFIYESIGNLQMHYLITDNIIEIPADTTSDFLTSLLIPIGFNNTVGKIIIYLLIAVMITFILVYFKMHTFITLLINTLLLGVFVFIGWIPIYVVIVLGLTFMLGIYKTVQGGI
jgi:hypothetical protein